MSIIFNLIKQNWIGALIGIGVAIILSIILDFTALKESRKLRIIITTTLIVGCMLSGMFIQSFYFKNDNPEKNEDIYNEEITNLDPNKYTHITSDSGFDRTYVEEKRPLAEVCEDKFANLNLVEYADVIIFSYDYIYDNVDYCANIIMYKANKSLVFDGCFNIKLKYNCEATLLNIKPDAYFNPTSTELNSTEYPVTYSEMWRGDNFTNKNFESQVDNGYRYPFWQNPVLPRWYRITKPSEINALCGHDIWSAGTTNTSSHTISIFKKAAEQFCYRLRETLFQQIGELTIMLNKDSASNSMDTVYNDIYNAVKGKETKTYTLDVTNHFYYYGTEIKDEKTEYVLYNNKNYINLNYTNRTDSNCFKIDNGKNDNDAIDKANSYTPVDSKDVEQVNQITFKLINKNNRDLSEYDPKSAPVKIKLTNSNDTKKTYVYVFDTIEKIKSQIVCGIASGNYKVEIESNVLDIGNIGNLKVDNSKTVLISFDYQYNTILTSVRLNPLSNFDFSKLDIINNPVIITFNNGTSSYNFEFNTLESLNQTIVKRLPFGSYNWAINSTELAFKEKNGTIEINVNNHEFVFNYDYKTNIEYKITASTGKYYNTEDSFIRFNLTPGFNDKTFKVKSATLFIIYFEETKESEIKSYSGFRINDTGSLILQDNPFSFDVEKSDLKDNEYNYFQIQLKLEDDSIIQTNMTNFKLKFNNGLLNDPYLFSVVFTLTREQ